MTKGRTLSHVYFSANLEPAIWGAELAVSLSGEDGQVYIYVAELTGPFADETNLTNKRFPGKPTRSYHTSHPLRAVEVVEDWKGHSAEVLQGMLDSLAEIKRQRLWVIED